jgi:hypothetical protein
MIRRIAMTVLGLLLVTGLTTTVTAHHSYLLSVQQLRATLTKAPSMAKGLRADRRPFTRGACRGIYSRH